MSEEIKETLDRAKNLKYKCDCCEEIAPGKYIMRDDKQTDNLIEAVYIIDKLLDYITNLQQKVEQLENIRKEVIEYIKDNACYSEGHCKCSFSQIALDNLLNILNKGENNE